jgi:ubiquinone/menaquinone biosynthesis C-methylase UbiE
MIVAAFDHVAAQYDVDFTHTPLARALRMVVWTRLAAHFHTGDQVLELNCGTGEDAAWLAQRGVRVMATDLSPAMLNVTERKAREHSVSELIETRVLDLAAPPALPEERVDGAFSNFGGLNCINDLRPLAGYLGEVVRPGGTILLVPMNRWCVWEIAWHLLHLQPGTALRRLRSAGVEAHVDGGKLQVWYPGIPALRRTFGPMFQLKRVIGLGVFLPPSYLEPVVAKRPRLWCWLMRLERVTAARFPFNRLADHVILEFQRVASP